MPDPQIKAFKTLVGSGELTEEKLEAAHRTARKNPERSLAQVLVDDYGVSRDQIVQALSEHYRVEFFAFQEGTRPLQDDRLRWDVAELQFKQFAPLAWEGDRLVVAMVDPKNVNRRDDVSLELAAQTPDAHNRPLVKVTTREDLHKLLGI